ncbi:EamA family transporter [Haloarcula salinisoli]|uniref:EamA family transporter n=1 Tax=Haloarcula salinisoli TaxID=2487746 RepID=A0A8J7YID7_9EURY|nr:EamA family transporter [Halomicroarcula salinisoli]MBX0286551.1 EamA family transporter [Halomicroarcula salinisoli]MBX0303901.1 EamA family transporter [Halomicroarcula salinisoli]
MRYLVWAIIALLGYTAVPPLVKLATADIPSDVVVLISNGILVVAAVGIILTADVSVTPYLTHERSIYAYGAGVALTVGIISYYRALAAGPVSVVVPIFGMFIATSSILGIAFLDEPLTARKVAGIGLAVAAIYLTSVE